MVRPSIQCQDFPSSLSAYSPCHPVFCSREALILPLAFSLSAPWLRILPHASHLSLNLVTTSFALLTCCMCEICDGIPVTVGTRAFKSKVTWFIFSSCNKGEQRICAWGNGCLGLLSRKPSIQSEWWTMEQVVWIKHQDGHGRNHRGPYYLTNHQIKGIQDKLQIQSFPCGQGVSKFSKVGYLTLNCPR